MIKKNPKDSSTFTEVSSLYHKILYYPVEQTSFVVQRFLGSLANSSLTWRQRLKKNQTIYKHRPGRHLSRDSDFTALNVLNLIRYIVETIVPLTKKKI